VQVHLDQRGLVREMAAFCHQTYLIVQLFFFVVYDLNGKRDFRKNEFETNV